ncbi:hypothetical protein ACFX13_009243 [Malus domestica]
MVLQSKFRPLVVGFFTPIKSSFPNSTPTSYNNIPPPMEDFQLAKQKAQEIIIANLAIGEGISALKDFIPYNGVLNLEGAHRPLLVCR